MQCRWAAPQQAVDNLRECIALNSTAGSKASGVSLAANVLLWDKSNDAPPNELLHWARDHRSSSSSSTTTTTTTTATTTTATTAATTGAGGGAGAAASAEAGPSRGFDLVMASDCLFFTDFHTDLVHTLFLLATGKAPPSTPLAAAATDATAAAVVEVDDDIPLQPATGDAWPQVWLLAPTRGKTAAQFIEKALPLFHITRSCSYHPEVVAAHKAALAGNASSSGGGSSSSTGGVQAYDPDLHFPVLLVLRPRKQDEVST